MESYLEIYSQWYPATYGLKPYPNDCDVTYTTSYRNKLLESLSNEQKELVEKHRKYLFRSLFLRKQFLRDTDWEFLELQIDYNYHISVHPKKLYCACGKRLKYQFIIQSKSSKKKLALGISHFADHLQISPKIANEIKNGVNTVDFALDNLLWLKENKYSFPEDLWKRYCIAHYRNNTLNTPVQLNNKLLKRLVEFRKAKMPIFTSDYRTTLEEISKVNKIALISDEDTFVNNKQYFEKYCSDLVNLSNHNYYRMNKYTERNRLVSEKRLDRYVEEIYEALLEIDQAPLIKKRRVIKTFMSTSQHKEIDSELTWLIYEQFIKHNWNENFFLSIPRHIRENLKKIRSNYTNASSIAITEEKDTNEVTRTNTTQARIKDKSNSIAKEMTTKPSVVKTEEGNKVSTIGLNTSIKLNNEQRDYRKFIELLENDDLCLEYLYNIITLPKGLSEARVAILLEILFEMYKIESWIIGYKLLDFRKKAIEANTLDQFGDRGGDKVFLEKVLLMLQENSVA